MSRQQAIAAAVAALREERTKVAADLAELDTLIATLERYAGTKAAPEPGDLPPAPEPEPPPAPPSRNPPEAPSTTRHGGPKPSAGGRVLTPPPVSAAGPGQSGQETVTSNSPAGRGPTTQKPEGDGEGRVVASRHPGEPRGPGRKPSDLRKQLVATLESVGKWMSTAELAEACDAPPKDVSTKLFGAFAAGEIVRRPGPPAPGNQVRHEYGAKSLLGGRAAAGVAAASK